MCGVWCVCVCVGVCVWCVCVCVYTLSSNTTDTDRGVRSLNYARYVESSVGRERRSVGGTMIRGGNNWSGSEGNMSYCGRCIVQLMSL